MRIVVVGQGYVGLPLTKAAVGAGHQVLGYDVDLMKVEALSVGTSPIDDVTDSDVSDMLATGRYLPVGSSAALKEEFDAAIITVPTPLANGAPDLSYVKDAGWTIGEHLRPDALVVLESTSYPGTTEEVLKPILEEASGMKAGSDFQLGFSPERIDPGNETWTFVTTPKLVSGLTPTCLEKVQALYDTMVDSTHTVDTIAAAELAKVWENTFRHVNVALANEMAGFAHEMGIDAWEAIEAAATKPFGFMKFLPGPGVGGHCLPIDPAYLAWRAEKEVGRPFRFVQLANDVNDHQPEYVASRALKILNAEHCVPALSRVLVLGMAYKANSSDCRETPAEGVVRGLREWGVEVDIHDPHAAHDADAWGARRVYAQVEDALIPPYHLVILVTNHAEYEQKILAESGLTILDTRGVLDRLDGVHRL